MKAFIPTISKYTAAQISAGAANNDKAQFIIVVDGSGAPVSPQVIYQGKGDGTAPSTVATSASVAAAVAAITVSDWAAGAVVITNELRRAVVAAGTIEAGDLIRSNAGRTTGAAFDANESANWTEISPDLVTSVAGRTGAVVIAESDVTNLTVDLAAKAPIASPTFTGTVSGVTKTMVGLGSADNTADTAKPISTAQQIALNLKLDTSVSVVSGHPVFSTSTKVGNLGTYTASASSTYPGGTYEAWKAFDGLTTTEWATNQTGVATLTLQLPVAQAFTSFIGVGRGDGTSLECPTTWAIQGSNDGTIYTTIYSDSNPLNTARQVSFANTTKYLYWRFNMLSGGLPAGNNGLSWAEYGFMPNVTPEDLGLKVDKVSGKVLSTNDYTTAEQTKLSGIAAGATVNSTDVQLRDRSTHTGSQAESTITNLTTDLAAKVDVTANNAAMALKEDAAKKGSINGYAGLDSTAKVPTQNMNTDTTREAVANKGVANGYAGLDGTGLVPTSQLPAGQALTQNQTNFLSSLVTTQARNIPAFTAPTATGTLGTYTALASSEFNATYPAWHACQAAQGTEWATASTLTNFWLRVQFPVAKVVTQIQIAGRAGVDAPGAGWMFQGSQDGSSFTTLYTSLAALGSTIVTVPIANTTAYLYYRMFAPTASAGSSNPGLSVFYLAESLTIAPTSTTI